MARRKGTTSVDMVISTRDRIDALATKMGLEGDKAESRGQLLDLLLDRFENTATDIELSQGDREIVDRAVELGATRDDLHATGLVWAAKSFVTRQTSTKIDRSVNVASMSDIEIEAFGDIKNHPEISRERVGRTIARIERWNESSDPSQSIVVSATYIDKLRKELWFLTDGKISQVSRRLIVEVLPDTLDPHDLGQFQNRRVPSIAIGVFAFRDLLETLIENPAKLAIAQEYFAEIDTLDRVS